MNKEKIFTISKLIVNGITEISAQSDNVDTYINPGSLATPTDNSIVSLNIISSENKKSIEKLKQEPSISRVLVKVEDSEVLEFFVCRDSVPTINFQLSNNARLISYKSPMGYIASQNIGDKITLPNDKTAVLLCKEIFTPNKTSDGWDAKKVTFHLSDTEVFSTLSLIDLLNNSITSNDTSHTSLEDFSDYVFEETIKEGVHREIITEFKHRDQSILNKEQDRMFRLKLDSQIILLGPPGTGKTTTLIKRLGLKSDIRNIEGSDKAIVERAYLLPKQPKLSDSWLMFTPSPLLKEYAKEAFAAENVPASDIKIKTWDEFRRKVSRDTFNILKSQKKLSGLQIERTEPNTSIVKALVTENYFKLFKSEANLQTLNKLEKLIRLMPKYLDMDKSLKIEELLNNLSEKRTSLSSIFPRLLKVAENLQLKFKIIEQENKKIVEKFLREAFRENNQILVTATEFLNSRSDSPKFDNASSFNEICSSILDYAADNFSEEWKLNKKYPLLEKVGLKDLENYDSLINVSKNFEIIGLFGKLKDPLEFIYDSYTEYYSIYRENHLLTENQNITSKIYPLELDVVLLCCLWLFNEINLKPDVILLVSDAFDDDNKNLSNIEIERFEAIKSSLETFTKVFMETRMQILVDEVSDFSLIQLAAMRSFAHPETKSFFCCGDINQRMTDWGIKSEEEVKTFIPRLETFRLETTYRQSEILEFVSKSIRYPDANLKSDVSLKGFKPIFFKYSLDNFETYLEWISERIREIETIYKCIPSISFFVPEAKDIEFFANQLSDKLAEDNLEVVPCYDGRVLGSEESIRVFSADHIKGLEFEAVFMHNVSKFKSLYPSLFRQYAYIASTRAARFLAFASPEEFPEELMSFQNILVDKWND